MYRTIIECGKCKKKIYEALWIENKDEYTNTPYCTGCYTKIKEKDFKNGIGLGNKIGFGTDGAENDKSHPEPNKTDCSTNRTNEPGGSIKVSWRYGATDN